MVGENLEYKVVHVSGQEEKGIVDQSFSTKEWISTKNCEYPQEIILRLKQKGKLEKIEILCHPLLIPQRIEVLIGNSDSDEGDGVNFSDVYYETQGVVRFQNLQTGVRELKSIIVDCTGWLLKLKIFENFLNIKTNPYNQVGLINISITGHYLTQEEKSGHSDNKDEDSSSKPETKNNDESTKICVFCGESNKSFTKKELTNHYKTACPMLKKCDKCKKILETSNLNNHLLNECEYKGEFKQCPRCQETVPLEIFEDHIDDKICPSSNFVSVTTWCFFRKQGFHFTTG